MGGLSEKFLTLEEAARQLHLGTDAVETLIQEGRLPAFRLGGQHLRIRMADLKALQGQRSQAPESTQAPRRPAGSRQEEVRFRSASAAAVASVWDRVVDFLYFNDFYLVGILIFLTLLAIIFLL